MGYVEKLKQRVEFIKDALHAIKDAQALGLEIDAAVVAVRDTKAKASVVGIKLDEFDHVNQICKDIIRAFSQDKGLSMGIVISKMMQENKEDVGDKEDNE